MFLNIGCGNKRIEGAVNIDLDSPNADICIDVTNGLPYQDNSVEAIRSEHFIEHLSKTEAYIFFREARRVLVPGGVLRISTPCMDSIIQAYKSDSKMEWETDFNYSCIETRCEMVNIAFRDWGHKWIYSQQEIENIGSRTGFRYSKKVAKDESIVSIFKDIDYREGSLTIEFQKNDSRIKKGGLVSILIPAYNPRYIREAIESARFQTYQNKEIIVSDDSLSNEIELIVKEFKDVKYVKNPGKKGGPDNYRYLYSISNGDYIKYLNDDDLLDPHCLEVFVGALSRHQDVTLVTSHRQLIDESGSHLDDLFFSVRPVNESQLINGQYIFSMLRYNIIGEPSTTMFRKSDMEIANRDSDIFNLFGHKVDWTVDMVMWLKLLSMGDLAYFYGSYSSFRIHSEQQQRQKEAISKGENTWSEIMKIRSKIGMDRTLFSHRACRPI